MTNRCHICFNLNDYCTCIIRDLDGAIDVSFRESVVWTEDQGNTQLALVIPGEAQMPWTIRKQGGKFQVVKKDGGKVVGTHDSRESAIQQLKALHANVKH